MDKKNEFRNMKNSDHKNLTDAQNYSLKSHNEKRKAQDSSNGTLKDSYTDWKKF